MRRVAAIRLHEYKVRVCFAPAAVYGLENENEHCIGDTVARAAPKIGVVFKKQRGEFSLAADDMIIYRQKSIWYFIV